MTTALLRQIFIGLLTALGAMSLVFVLLRVVPGDPAMMILGDWGDIASDEHIASVRASLGIDRPLWQQYFLFLRSVALGEFGISFRTGETVASMVALRFPLTAQLALAGFAVAALIGLPAGIIGAVRRNTWIDRMVMSLTMLGLAAPNFWVGLLLLRIFSLQLGWFPLFGAQQSGTWIDLARALVLPAFAIGTHSAALLARVTRSAMLEVLKANYITAARAKGVIERKVILKHALRNAALPIITLMGVSMAYLLGGSVIVEVVFSRPGMGRLLVDGIFTRDYPVVQGTVLVFAILVVSINLLTDVLYGLLDPRLRAR